MSGPVEYMSLSKLRHMNADGLRALPAKPTVVMTAGAEPVATLVPYALFLQWQDLLSVHIEAAARREGQP